MQQVDVLVGKNDGLLVGGGCRGLLRELLLLAHRDDLKVAFNGAFFPVGGFEADGG